MNLTNRELGVNERNRLRDYARGKHCERYKKDSQHKNSTYVVWNGIGIREYGWNNLMDLCNQLKNRWQLDDEKRQMAMPCAVAAYKLRMKECEKEAEKRDNDYVKDKVEIPDFF